MSRSPDLVLRAAWQRRLRAFQRFSGTVAQFCFQQGVSVASFYQWRRKLAEHRPTGTAAAATLNHQAATHALPSLAPTPAFVPLKLVGGETSRICRSGGASIQLAGGTRIDVAGDDLELVQAVLQSVLRHDADCTGSTSLSSPSGTSAGINTGTTPNADTSTSGNGHSSDAAGARLGGGR
jgi:hypothetical protein